MAWKEKVSSCDLGPVCFSGDYKMGACNLFDEMPTSDWRSPSRVLEVTIHQVCYPMTENVLRQVFSQFGEVVEVYVYKGLHHVEARVVFQSKLEAAEAYGELHGRYIYDGCCQMEIKWGHLNTMKNLDKAAPEMLPSAALAPTASPNKTAMALTTSYAAATTTPFSETSVDDPASEHDTEQLIIAEDDITNDKLARSSTVCPSHDAVELVSMPSAATSKSLSTSRDAQVVFVETQQCIINIDSAATHTGLSTPLSSSMEEATLTGVSLSLSNNSMEPGLGTSTATISLANKDYSMEVKRYNINNTPAYSIGVVLSCPASKVYDACKVFGSIVHKGPLPHIVQFGIQVNRVQLRPIPWPSFLIYVAVVHLKKSGSVVLVISTAARTAILEVLQPKQPWPPPTPVKFMGGTNMLVCSTPCVFERGNNRKCKITVINISWVMHFYFMTGATMSQSTWAMFRKRTRIVLGDMGKRKPVLHKFNQAEHTATYSWDSGVQRQLFRGVFRNEFQAYGFYVVMLATGTIRRCEDYQQSNLGFINPNWFLTREMKHHCDDISCLLVQFWDLPVPLQEVSELQYGCEVTAILPSQLHNHFNLAFGDTMGELNTEFRYEADESMVFSYPASLSSLYLEFS